MARRGFSLRVRQSGVDCILGIKKDAHAHGGYFERDEAEAPLPSSKVDLSVLDRSISSELSEIVGKKALAPRFGSDIRRTLKTLRFHGADIEVALDEGFLFAGKRREPTHEIELELKTGEPAALFELGLALVDALPLTPSVLSKAGRAAELLSGKPPEPVRSASPRLRRTCRPKKRSAWFSRAASVSFLVTSRSLSEATRLRRFIRCVSRCAD